MSLELAKTISDARIAMRAPHIIDLCMTANDMEASRILVQGIQSEPIREELFRRIRPCSTDPRRTDLDLDQCVPRATRHACKGGRGATNAPGAVFFLCWRSAARAAVHFGCVPSKTPGRDEGKSLFARHSHPFRSEMAGAHRVRYQPPDDGSEVDRKCEGIIPAPEQLPTLQRVKRNGKSFAMLPPPIDRLQASSTKMREPKPQHRRKIARKHTPAPRVAMAHHPQFGWNFW